MGRARSRPGAFAWGAAFASYAAMSACGLAFHSLLRPGSPLRGLAYAGDMGYTACSCLGIAAGCLVDMGGLSDVATLPAGARVRRRLVAAAIVVPVAAMAGHAAGVDALPDQLYVQGVVLAGGAVMALQLRQPAWLVPKCAVGVKMPREARRCAPLLAHSARCCAREAWGDRERGHVCCRGAVDRPDSAVLG